MVMLYSHRIVLSHYYIFFGDKFSVLLLLPTPIRIQLDFHIHFLHLRIRSGNQCSPPLLFVSLHQCSLAHSLQNTLLVLHLTPSPHESICSIKLSRHRLEAV